jgi:hypothetical protein
MKKLIIFEQGELRMRAIQTVFALTASFLTQLVMARSMGNAAAWVIRCGGIAVALAIALPFVGQARAAG